MCTAPVCHRSLLTFVVMERGTLSYELLLRYLTLCVKGGHDAEVFDIYDIMRGSFPSLDTGALSLFIQSFSRTARWREALSILNEVKKVSGVLIITQKKTLNLYWSTLSSPGFISCHPNRSSARHHATIMTSSQQRCCTVT